MPLLFWVPKNTAFLLCLSNLAALGSNTFSLFWVPKNTAFLLKEKRCFWAPKRKAVFDPRVLKLLRPEKKSGNAYIEHAFAQIYCKKTDVSCHVRPMEKSRKKCCNLLWIRVCTSVLPGVYEHVIRGACTGRSHQLVFTVNYNTFWPSW